MLSAIAVEACQCPVVLSQASQTGPFGVGEDRRSPEDASTVPHCGRELAGQSVRFPPAIEVHFVGSVPAAVTSQALSVPLMAWSSSAGWPLCPLGPGLWMLRCGQSGSDSHAPRMRASGFEMVEYDILRDSVHQNMCVELSGQLACLGHWRLNLLAEAPQLAFLMSRAWEPELQT